MGPPQSWVIYIYISISHKNQTKEFNPNFNQLPFFSKQELTDVRLILRTRIRILYSCAVTISFKQHFP